MKTSGAAPIAEHSTSSPVQAPAAADWKQRGKIKPRLDDLHCVFDLQASAAYFADPESSLLQLITQRGLTDSQLNTLYELLTLLLETHRSSQQGYPSTSEISAAIREHSSELGLPDHVRWHHIEHEGSRAGGILLASVSLIPGPASWSDEQRKSIHEISELVFAPLKSMGSSTIDMGMDRFNTFEDAIMILNPESRILEANHPALRLLGYSFSELEYEPLFKVYPEEKHPILEARLQAMSHQNSAEFRESVLTRDGYLIPMHTRLAWKTWNGHKRLAWVSESVSGMHSSREMQSHAAELFRTIYEHASVPVVFYEPDGRLLKANQSFLNLTGCTEKEISSRKIQSFIHREDLQAHQRLTEQILSGDLNHSQHYEERLVLVGNEYVHISCLLLLIRSQDGKPLYFIKHVQNISDRKEMEKQLQHLATHDPLTNLPNRTMIRDRFIHARSIVKRQGTLLGLVYIDLDDFKKVNDTCGHNVGDRLLVTISERLRSCVRESDTVARIGGDEFVILLEGIRSSRDTLLVLRKAVDALSEPVEIEDHVISISASAGFSLYPFDGNTLTELLNVADFAMYHAKKQNHFPGIPCPLSTPKQLPLFPSEEQ